LDVIPLSPTPSSSEGAPTRQFGTDGEKSRKKRPRPDNEAGDLTCPVCLDKKKNVVFDLCRHTFCGDCADKITSKKCPLCKTVNNGVDLIYL
jgi:hypothetical protein